MEPLGAAASGIAIGQLCFGIAKAVRLWREIEDLPSDLQDVVDRLEALGPVLQDLLEQCEEHTDMDQLLPRHVRSCVTYANKARDALSGLVKKLESSLDVHRKTPGSRRSRVRRKVKLAWATLQSDEIVKLERRLDSAVGMVLMCVSSYDRAIMQASHDRIADKTAAKVLSEQKALYRLSEERIARQVSFDMSTQLANMTKHLQMDKGTEKEYIIVRSESTWSGARLPSYKPSVTGKYVTKASKERSEWNMSIQLPAWMSQAVWQIQLCWSITGGWQQSLRSFSVRSRHSTIFTLVEGGDVRSMMGMFSKGEASPLDRDENGASLLYYATFSEQVETCRTLLDLGLEGLIDERDGVSESPLATLIMSRKNLAPQEDSNHRALVSVFQSRCDKIETLGIERMFDFERECSYADDWLRVFQRDFLPDYYSLPLRERAEAVRLGAFTTQDISVYRTLLTEDGAVSSEDVRGSVDAGFSLVHSMALALGKRFADEMQFDPRLGLEHDEDESTDTRVGWMPGMVRFKSYNEAWSAAVIETLKVASAKDLNRIETVVPWDWYRVPVWTGTPLISLIGGTLCRISPDISYQEWDAILHSVLRQWLRDLKSADIDLLQYGRNEALKIKFTETQVKGAFDADAITASRRHVRNTLRVRETWMQTVDDNHTRNDLHWLPIRIVGLDYGPLMKDWRLWWAPEFEVFAAEFWATAERPRAVMPGSWVDS